MIPVAALIIAVTVDVDHISVGGPDQESPDAPRLRGERVHDVESAPFRFLVGLLDAVPHVDGDHELRRSSGILGDELNGGAAVGGAGSVRPSPCRTPRR